MSNMYKFTGNAASFLYTQQPIYVDASKGINSQAFSKAEFVTSPLGKTSYACSY